MFPHKLSIIIPCFNEGRSIGAVLKAVSDTCLSMDMPVEIIIVNDGSTDNTSAAVNNFMSGSRIPVIEIKHSTNKGKGACIRSAISSVSGSIILIQDADLEYDPKDYHKMLPLIVEDKADVVYGSRFRGSEPHRVLFFFHTIGNKLLTFVSNIFTRINLTDMETGYKMFRAETLKQINLQEDRFGFEPEVTAKISRIKGIRIYEVGISYFGRTYEEGKKINWRDGMTAIYCIIRYNIFSRK